MNQTFGIEPTCLLQCSILLLRGDKEGARKVICPSDCITDCSTTCADTIAELLGSNSSETVLEWLQGKNTYTPSTLPFLFQRIFLQWLLPSAETLIDVKFLEQAGIYEHMKCFSNRPSVEAKSVERRFSQYNLTALQSWAKEVPEEHMASYKILLWLAREKEAMTRLEMSVCPYTVDHYQSVHIMFLLQMQDAVTISNLEQAHAYIHRLEQCGAKFRLYELDMRRERGRGIVLSTVSLDKTANTIQGSMNMLQREDNILIKTLCSKYKASTGCDLPDKLVTQAQYQIQSVVIPAYASLLKTVQEIALSPDDRAGIWKVPNGLIFYTQCLRMMTTTNLTPSEVHAIGLREVHHIKEEMQCVIQSLNDSGDMLLDSAKSLRDNLQIFRRNERFKYPTGGQAECLQDYRLLLSEIKELVKPMFSVLPSVECDIKPMSQAMASGGCSGYYMNGSMDLQRPGCFYANISSMSTVNKGEMRTLVAHEAVPGHHYQISVQLENTSLPMFRRTTVDDSWNWTNPFSEGWALYAEKLAHEIGFYDSDPYAMLGYRSAELWRSVRCVVDTGLHAFQWDREQAVDYMLDNLPKTRSMCEQEVDRYCVVPGQACSYKIGQLKILELREKCREREGDKFDLKMFHDKIISIGAVPLELLEELYFS